MFNSAAGYYRVEQGIEVDKYYVLSLKNLRKPVLLRFSCKSAFLAKRYIILKTDPSLHEVIKGEDALHRGIKISVKRLGKNQWPEKYCYPKGCDDWRKKKQHRTNYRDDIRRLLESHNKLKQFTIAYRGKTYTLYEFTISKAFYYLHKYTNMTWDHFVNKVSNKPLIPKKETVYIKTRVNIIMINQFNLIHHGRRKLHKHTPGSGKMAGLERQYLSITKPKPKRLLF